MQLRIQYENEIQQLIETKAAQEARILMLERLSVYGPQGQGQARGPDQSKLGAHRSNSLQEKSQTLLPRALQAV